MLLGRVGDDLTGSGDLGNTLVQGGLASVRCCGIPDAPAGSGDCGRAVAPPPQPTMKRSPYDAAEAGAPHEVAVGQFADALLEPATGDRVVPREVLSSPASSVPSQSRLRTIYCVHRSRGAATPS